MKGVFQNLIEANGSITGAIVNLTEAEKGAIEQGIDINRDAIGDCVNALIAASEIVSDMVDKLSDEPCYLENDS